jgi:hypothetical protein
MSTHIGFVQQFARLFHRHHEALSSEARGDKPTSHSLEDHQRLVAAARMAILELETKAWLGDDRRRYFAKPGEAEWGC